MLGWWWKATVLKRIIGKCFMEVIFEQWLKSSERVSHGVSRKEHEYVFLIYYLVRKKVGYWIGFIIWHYFCINNLYMLTIVYNSWDDKCYFLMPFPVFNFNASLYLPKPKCNVSVILLNNLAWNALWDSQIKSRKNHYPKVNEVSLIFKWTVSLYI